MTVLIPSYQHGIYIEECIQSVLNQSYNHLEVILIDDGSKDDTLSRVSRFQSDSRLKVVANSNKGLSKTLNEGLTLARGQYIAFLASDDCFRPEKIEIQLKRFLANPSVGLVYTRTESFGAERKTFPKNLYRGQVFTQLLRQNFVPASSVMISRKVFDSVGLFDESLKVEDWDYWLRVAKKHPFDAPDEILTMYRVHPANTSSRQKALDYTPYVIQTLKKHAVDDPGRQIRDIAYRACARYGSSSETTLSELAPVLAATREKYGFSLKGHLRVAARFLFKR